MKNSELLGIWKAIETQLTDAVGFLQDKSGFDIKTNELEIYQEYLQANELELAMYELEAIAYQHGGSDPDFWQRLSKVTTLMELSEKTIEYKSEYEKSLGKNNL